MKLDINYEGNIDFSSKIITQYDLSESIEKIDLIYIYVINFALITLYK